MKVNQDTIATDGPSLLRISMHYRPNVGKAHHQADLNDDAVSVEVYTTLTQFKAATHDRQLPQYYHILWPSPRTPDLWQYGRGARPCKFLCLVLLCRTQHLVQRM